MLAGEGKPVRLSLSKAWEDSRQIIRRDFRLLSAVALALIVLPQTIFGAFVSSSAPGEVSLTAQLVLLLVALIAFAAQIALNRLAIPPASSVGEAISSGLARCVPLFVAFMLMVVGLMLLMIPILLVAGAAGIWETPAAGARPSGGILVLIVVGLALAFAVFQLSVPIAAAERGGPIYLLRQSWRLARGNYTRLLAFMGLVIVGLIVVWIASQLVAGVVSSLLFGPPEPGSVSALLRAFAASLLQAAYTIVTGVMLARVYVQLAGPAEAQASVPISGT
jgi:hypothetical protein